jgi:AcrR family transcriptional regulator
MARKRSEECHLAILGATATLLDERGYLDLTIEEVAQRAGAGKQTIYRWWGSKSRLALEAYATGGGGEPSALIADTGSVEGDLRAHLSKLVALMADERRTLTIAGLMAEAQTDPDFAGLFREKFLHPKQAAMRDVFERGKARGELPALADANMLADLVYGPIWYRMLVGHAPLDAAFVEALVTSVIAAARSPVCRMR